MTLSPAMKRKLIEIVKEDISKGDVTSALLEDKKCRAYIRVNENCVLAGVEEAVFLFKRFGAKAKALAKDGQKVKKGRRILVIEGRAKKMLSVERTALNILGRMSDVATICHKAAKIAGKKCKVELTRKTMPGFNLFDKKAAHIGEALPHRLNLNEMVLIKDNHLIVSGSIEKILGAAKKKIKNKKIEIEVSNLREALLAAKLKPYIIMLDNFSVAKAKAAVKALRKAEYRGKIELSGGINLNNLQNYIRCGADFISMGELTKKAQMVDMHMTVKKVF